MIYRQYLYGYKASELTVGRLLEDKAAKNEGKPFLHYLPDGRRFTYREIYEAAKAAAAGFTKLGIEHGDHVALFASNSPEQLLSIFGLGMIGAVVVPINSASSGQLLQYYLDQSDSMAVIVDDELRGALAEVAPLLPNIELAITIPRGDADAAKLPWPTHDFQEVISGPGEEPKGEVRFNDLAMLLYSSGTTGPAKANMLLQATTLMVGMTTAESHGYHDSDITYSALPLSHAAGLLCLTYGALVADAQVAISRHFSVSRFWDEIRSSKATVTTMLSSMINLIWSQPERPDDADNALRTVNMSPIPSFARDFERRFNLRIVGSYGLSDYAMSAIFTVNEPVDKLGSAGRPRKGMEIRIVDQFDEDVPQGEQGEIVLRSNNMWGMSQGYYKMPEASLAAMRNGWFHTGDLGHFDKDGYLYFDGRTKDVIRYRGKNISAQDVEKTIAQHPDVSDVAVFALPSELSEDEVAACIVLSAEATAREADIHQFFVSRMPAFMAPRFIVFTDSLPRTGSQKIKKNELKALFEKDRAQLWDREKSDSPTNRAKED